MVVPLDYPTIRSRPADRSNPESGDHLSLIDQYGRTATDLRISLTDRCNLRCGYCMPAEGLAWLPRPELLTAPEIVRLAHVGVSQLGVRTIRFTGGEPLLRPDLVDIVAECARLRPRPELSMTSNAVGLTSRAHALASAGLTRVNISLDTLRPGVFTRITHRDLLPRALQGIAAAADAGLRPIKINAVLIRGINDDEATELLTWAVARDYELRFIELMPLDAQRGWDRGQLVSAAETRELLRKHVTLTRDPTPCAGAPAERWLVNGGPETVSFIASMTEPFCTDCRRTRLTADGQVRSCLFSHTEQDLRGALRSGADDHELAELWRAAMWGKPAGHGVDKPDFRPPARPMSAIGG